MYLGKPVIATAYGGSLDFANEDNSYTVGYELTRVGPGAAPYPPDGTWAEPDLEQAARAMRHVFEHPGEAAERGERGRKDVRRTHSADAVGRQMRARLSQLPGRRPEATAERAEPTPPAEYVPRIPHEPSAASARAAAQARLCAPARGHPTPDCVDWSSARAARHAPLYRLAGRAESPHGGRSGRTGRGPRCARSAGRNREAELDRLGAVLERAEHRLDLEAHHRETSGERLASTYGRAQWELRASGPR